MRKIVLIFAATVALVAGNAYAAEPGDLPIRAAVNAGDKSYMWVKPAEVGKNDTLKRDLERSQRNRFAYDPKKPATAIYLIAGPLIAMIGGGAVMGIL